MDKDGLTRQYKKLKESIIDANYSISKSKITKSINYMLYSVYNAKSNIDNEKMQVMNNYKIDKKTSIFIIDDVNGCDKDVINELYKNDCVILTPEFNDLQIAPDEYEFNKYIYYDLDDNKDLNKTYKIINCLLYKRNVAIFIDDFMSIKNKEKLREFIERIVTISEHHNTSIIPISIVKDKTKNILNVGKPIYSDFNIDDEFLLKECFSTLRWEALEQIYESKHFEVVQDKIAYEKRYLEYIKKLLEPISVDNQFVLKKTK